MITTRSVVLGWVDAVITIIVFVLVPIYLLPLLSGYVSEIGPTVGWIPVVGIALAGLAFISRVTQGSRYSGIALILWGIVLLIYEYILFGFGSLSFEVTPAAGQTILVQLGFPFLLILLLLIPALYVVRGFVRYAGEEGTRPYPSNVGTVTDNQEPPPPEPPEGSIAD